MQLGPYTTERWTEALRARLARQPEMLYPNTYVWLLFFSGLDIMMTWIILLEGGAEVNALANAVIERYNLVGMVIYKFALVTFFIILCEIIGRQKTRTGRRLARVAVALTCVPVAVAFFQLFSHPF